MGTHLRHQLMKLHPVNRHHQLTVPQLCHHRYKSLLHQFTVLR
ncbi:hypothetical protein HID58_062386 [Brassica napus]|uniref:Uncharacterized protein n=1 Tax=Brassica napus TaxID=3708 RepID=A0ABQ8A1A6_BRANA|nr:hypothetical protein HID58_062386 [Brassica napus]